MLHKFLPTCSQWSLRLYRKRLLQELLSVSRDGNVSVSSYLGMCEMLIMFVCIERGESVSEIVRSPEIQPH